MSLRPILLFIGMHRWPYFNLIWMCSLIPNMWMAELLLYDRWLLILNWAQVLVAFHLLIVLASFFWDVLIIYVRLDFWMYFHDIMIILICFGYILAFECILNIIIYIQLLWSCVLYLCILCQFCDKRGDVVYLFNLIYCLMLWFKIASHGSLDYYRLDFRL